MKRLAWLAAAMLVAPAAAAQDSAGPAGGFSWPSRGMPSVQDTPPSGERPKQARGSIKLFNTDNTIRSWVIDVGPVYVRKVQDETPAERSTGFRHPAPLAGEIAIGTTYTTPYKPFYLFGRQRTLLRILDDKSFSWSLFHQDLGGGIMLGPFEPEAGVGVSVLTADIFHGDPSIQLFTPRVSAGVGIHLGRFRVDVTGHAEYLWRWFQPDYLIRGVTLGLRFDAAPRQSPYAEAPR